MNYKDILNLTDIITENAKSFPNNIAIDNCEKRISYLELDSQIWKLSSYYKNLGIKEADIISLEIDNDLLLIITLLSLARIGATSYITPNSISKLEKEELFIKINVKNIITDKLQINKLDTKKIMINELILEKQSEIIDYSIKSINSKIPYIYITGSGSTGKSKIIPITHEQEIEKVKLSLQWLPQNKNQRLFSMSQMYFYSSIIMYLRAFNAGMTAVFLKRDKLSNSFCKQFNITILFSSVFHIHRMLEKSKKEDFKSLNMIYITGSIISNNLKEKIEKNLTRNVYLAYGTNEVSTATLIKPTDLNLNSTGNVGRVIKGVKVEIVDEDDNTLKYNQIGLIRIKSPASATTYIDDNIATKKAFKNGWFYPNDLGKLTKENELIYLGRADHMMNMNGINIYPAEIENAIMSHEEVLDAVSVPLKSKVNQDIPICIVSLKKGSKENEETLKEYSFNIISSRSPKMVLIHDRIPRNIQGKVIRKELYKIIEMKITKYREKQK